MRILILGAFKEELNDIYNNFTELKETIIAKRRCLMTKQGTHEIVISLCGIGTTAASSTTTAFCETFAPDLIIMCGVAGGLDQSLEIGDLVLANKIIDADLYALSDILRDTPYKSCLTDPHTLQPISNEYEIETLVLKCASSVSLEGIKIGAIVTSNIFPAPKSLFENIQNMGCMAIEMESVGIFKAAQYYDTPVMTIRAISNLLDKFGADLGTKSNALSICSEKLALFLKAFLNNVSELELIAKQNQQKRISNLVGKYGLNVHPEGGWFRRTYKSMDMVRAEGEALIRHQGELRAAGTSIIYLLAQGEYSAWHTVQSDETWSFHSGDPLLLRVINPLDGELDEVLLSQTEGLLQYTIKSGYIFSAESVGRYSLTGCTVTPGFDFKDFKLISKEEFLMKFPQHAMLTRLVRDEVESIEPICASSSFFNSKNKNTNDSSSCIIDSKQPLK